MQEEENWDLTIKPRHKWHDIDLAALWRYRDLLMLLVRRDFVAIYKQTILGPLWFFIQPILTAFTFTLIFGFANINIGNVPRFLFYLSGITLWSYFSDCLTKTSTTFIANAGVFGKVYFPRLIMPLSIIVSSLIKLGIQFLIFLIVWIYYSTTTNLIHPEWGYIWLLPVLIIMMAGFGLGFGIFISSLTTKYRDLTFLIGFGVQLLMYASSVVFPLSKMSINAQNVLRLNPITNIIEAFKFIFLGNEGGMLDIQRLIVGFVFMVVLLIVSVIVFNKVEKSFMDTV